MSAWKRIVDAVFNRHPALEWSEHRPPVWATAQDSKLDYTAGDRTMIQGYARRFEAKSSIVNRMADLWECYVVGANGLQIFPASSSQPWNIAAARQWGQWKPFADISSRDGWDVLQGKIARSWFIDGEVFILLTKEGPFSRVQLIEAHRCKSPQPERANIVDGVEVDANGRPTAYWFDNEGDGKRLTRVDASYVVHVYEPSRPGQYRGMPLIAPVMNDIRDLDLLKEYEIKHAKNAARISVVHKTATGEQSASGAGRRAAISIGGVTASGATSAQTRNDYYRTTLGGENLVLLAGDELETFANGRPADASFKLWDNLTDSICIGTGIPKVLVFPDSMQGTVYRGALDMANAFFRARSAALAVHFQRVWEWVIGNDASLISGRPNDWRTTSVRPPKAVNVDVGRNSSAAINELAAGLKTYQSLYAETGDDWEKMLEQKAKEAAKVQELATKYGVAPEAIAASSLPAAAADPQPVDQPMP